MIEMCRIDGCVFDAGHTPPSLLDVHPHVLNGPPQACAIMKLAGISSLPRIAALVLWQVEGIDKYPLYQQSG